MDHVFEQILDYDNKFKIISEQTVHCNCTQHINSILLYVCNNCGLIKKYRIHNVSGSECHNNRGSSPNPSAYYFNRQLCYDNLSCNKLLLRAIMK